MFYLLGNKLQHSKLPHPPGGQDLPTLSGEEATSQLPCCLHAELPPRLGPGREESVSFPHHGHGPCPWLFSKEGKNFMSKESLKTQQFVQTNGLAPRSSTHLCTLECCLTNSSDPCRGTCWWAELLWWNCPHLAGDGCKGEGILENTSYYFKLPRSCSSQPCQPLPAAC